MIGRKRDNSTGNRTGNPEAWSRSIVVPSQVPGADFVAHLYPKWKFGDEGTEKAEKLDVRAHALACQYLHHVTKKWSIQGLVQHSTSIELSINTELAMGYVVETPISVALSGFVVLTPADGAKDVADKYVARLREGCIENELRRGRIDFLRTVFADPENAWLWWLDHGEELLRILPSHAFEDLMSKLENARSDTAQKCDNNAKDSFANIIGDFITTRAEPQHADFAVRVLRQYLTHFDQADLVKRLDLLRAEQQGSNGASMERERDSLHPVAPTDVPQS